MPAAHGGARGHVVGVHARLVHGLVEHLVETNVPACLADRHALGIAHHAQQLLRHRRDEDDSKVLIHGDDAVLHLGHDHAHGVVLAALLENAALDARDDGVVLGHLARLAGNFLDARVKIAVRKLIERSHGAVDQPFLGVHGQPDRDEHGQRGRQKHETDDISRGQNRHRLALGGVIQQKCAIFILIDGANRRRTFRVLMRIGANRALQGEGRHLFEQRVRALGGCIDRLTVRQTIFAENPIWHLERSERVGALLRLHRGSRIAGDLADSLELRQNALILRLRNIQTVIDGQKYESNQGNQGRRNCEP